MTISTNDREAWVTLALTPGIGPTRFQALIHAFGSPLGAQSAPFAFLCTVPGISRASATAIKEAASQGTGAQALEALEKIGGAVILFTDPTYPPQLREIHDPPMVLFAWGGGTDAERLERLERLSTPQAAIVGTRHPSQYGVDVTKGASTACASAGIAVVSGMARGCDAIAHSAALDGGGTTIGVLGNGFGVIYPAANRALYERVRSEGLLLSEFPPGEKPHAGSFPRRNRIISGLTRATLVIEAGGTSGALITAGFALDQGREVLAVPGPITSLSSIGTNRLLRDGATPYLGPDDLLGLFGASLTAEVEAPIPEAPITDPLLRHVPKAGALLDTIVDASRWPVAQVLDRLLEFELEGRVEQMPGRVFRRVS